MNIEYIQARLGQGNEETRKHQDAMTALMDEIKNTAGGPTPQQMMRLQLMMSEYARMQQLQSTMVKEFGDSLKGVIDKMK